MSLIAALHEAQERLGYLSRETQLEIAKKLDIPPAKVYGVVTFYSYFTETPRGKHRISVCTGTACFVRGAQKVLDAFAKELGLSGEGITKDGQFSLDSLRCVGACGLAPVVMVGDKVYGKVKPEDVKGILEEYR